ncbi:MAG TPA: MFS transporter [Bacteriovoracaceae bacterium]|nr:MFS transporter [Bacteriovoracaceae bacterium]
MSKTPNVPLKQHVRASFRDAAYTNLNIGMVESYFCAFMLALGISQVTSGLGTVIPQFLGVIFQLFSIRAFFTRYTLKNRIILFLTVQTLTMVPLVLIGWFKINSAFLVISCLGLYWASLLSLNPPWNKLIGHTVPVNFRLRFFSIRSQFGQLAVFIGLITSGFLLYWAKGLNQELVVYVGILIFGLVLKCLSLYEVKTNHIDYPLSPGSENRIRLRDFVKRLRGTEQGKLVTFMFLFYTSVHFCAPYFNPFMLGVLKFNYLEYMVIVSISYFGRVFVFKVLQRTARARHVDKILILSSIGIATSPLLWAFSQKFSWLMGVEFLSGCYWAGFELATILLYYQKIDDSERTSVITYITFFNTTGMVIGSFLGALFMRWVPVSWNGYVALFATSTFCRTVVIIFAPHIRFKGQIPKLISINRVFSVRPPFAVFSRPFIGKMRKKKKEEDK